MYFFYIWVKTSRAFGGVTNKVIAGKFYKLEEDGSILCETRGDCPNDVVNKVGTEIADCGKFHEMEFSLKFALLQTNNTVLEFRCAPRTTVGEPGAKESESGSPKYFLKTS